MHGRGGVALLLGSAVLALMAADSRAASVTLVPMPSPPHVVPPNVNFADDELVDSKKTARLEGGACAPEQCQSHCRVKLHAAGRCDGDLCVCRDLKARGRCQAMGYGCGEGEEGAAGRSNIINNNNNNNVLVVH